MATAAAATTGVDLIISTICNASFCNTIYDNPFIDALLSKKQTELLELTNDINGKHLRIGTYNNYPLSWSETHENGTVTGHGVAFALVDILRQKFNFTFEVVVPAYNYEIGGNKLEDSLIGLINSSSVDMAAAFLPNIDRYRRMVTFSKDVDEGVWMMMLKRPKESAAGSGLLAPFETSVWFLTLIAVLSFGPCITVLTYIRSQFIKPSEKHITLSPSFWFVYGAFIKQGTTLSPEANTTRVLFATWWIFIILLSAFYTANLTAFLTLSKFTLDIESTEDLYKKNYRWVSAKGGSVEFAVRDPEENIYYLSKMVANGRAVFRAYTSDQDFLPLVNAGAVLVKEQTAIDHLMYFDYLSKVREGVEEEDRCTYVVAPNAFMKRARAFAFPMNTTLTTLFDPVLTYLLQSGIVDFLEHRDLPTTKICPLDLQSKDRRLRNSDLMMTYMIMAVGLASAVAVFVIETIIKRYAVRRQTLKPLNKFSSKTFTFKDDSMPPPYDSLFGRNSKYRKSKKTFVNGREYWETKMRDGTTRLIPVRTPSALLYH